MYVTLFDVTGNTDEMLDQLFAFLSPAGAAAFLHLEAGPILRKRAGDRFASEGDDVSGKWMPLQESTVRMREAMNFPGEHPINRRTGELENWVVQGGWDAYPTAIGASLRYPDKRPSGELRNKVVTAQEGRTHPYTEPRPVLGVNETDLLLLTTAYAAAIEAVLR